MLQHFCRKCSTYPSTLRCRDYLAITLFLGVSCIYVEHQWSRQFHICACFVCHVTANNLGPAGKPQILNAFNFNSWSNCHHKLLHWTLSPLFYGFKLQNYHILAIPIYIIHTRANKYEMITKCLSCLFERCWRCKLIGVSTKGAANMVGILSGAVNRIIGIISGCNSNLYRVWCRAHQLYLAVQSVFETYVKESFQDPLHSLIKYFRRKSSFVVRK